MVKKGRTVLRVANLHVHIPTPGGTVRAVNGADFRLRAGQVLGLVGESGCGKTMTILALAGLLSQGARIVRGSIELNHRNITSLSAEEMRSLRGREVALIMQNPMSAFNPLITVGRHFTETIITHRGGLTAKEAREAALDFFRRFGLPRPAEVFDSYPFQLSGGMLQRIMIAIAVCLQPPVLLADEPTTALDATVRLQILGHLARLKEEYNTGILLVSHDLGVIAQLADEVAVMYCGYIVEMAPASLLFDHPVHPYTRALMASRPRMTRKRLKPVGGQPPPLLNIKNSCPFFDRCEEADSACLKYGMEPRETAGGHWVRCVNRGSEWGAWAR